MSRNRIIYQSQALFVGPTGVGALTQIQRVQSVSHNSAINRTNIQQFGQLGQVDRIQLTPPTVTMNFEALLVNAINAKALGFVVDGTVSCIASIASGTTDTHNYYISLAPEGSDVINTTGAGGFGFGNGFLSDARFQGAVGQTPTESYSVEALNDATYIISSGTVPTVDQRTGLPVAGSPQFVFPTAVTGTASSVAALQPGDISLTLTDTFGFDPAGLHVQNFNLNIPLARENINQLGTKFAFAKLITFPITVTAAFECVAGDIVAANLSDKLCTDNPVDFTIDLKEPSCSGDGNVAIRFNLKGAKLDSTNYTSNIGSNATVNFSYSTLLGGPEEITKGLFISGIST